jgi:hypothetical protein
VKAYITVYKSQQQDDILDRVYLDLDGAKARVAELEAKLRGWTSAPGIEIRDVERPAQWTEEQRIWLRGKKKKK